MSSSKGKNPAAVGDDNNNTAPSSTASTTREQPGWDSGGVRPSSSGPILSRYEAQKRRDWNTFCQYLKNQLRPPVALSQCNASHVMEFMRYLDQFGKTKVHSHGCVFFGQPEPPSPCACPLKQAWGSLDALVGRLRAAYEENGGSQETNPFAAGGIRIYLREIRDSQAKARGVPYKKKKKKRKKMTMTMTTTIGVTAAPVSVVVGEGAVIFSGQGSDGGGGSTSRFAS